MDVAEPRNAARRGRPPRGAGPADVQLPIRLTQAEYDDVYASSRQHRVGEVSAFARMVLLEAVRDPAALRDLFSRYAAR